MSLGLLAQVARHRRQLPERLVGSDPGEAPMRLGLVGQDVSDLLPVQVLVPRPPGRRFGQPAVSTRRRSFSAVRRGGLKR
jgi:hypothetical protein